MARSEWKPGQVVWAKVTGYPWWPGLIAEVSSDCCPGITVKFLGETSHAVLEDTKVRDFQAHFHELSKMTRTGTIRNKFKQGLEEALRLLSPADVPVTEVRKTAESRPTRAKSPQKKPRTAAPPTVPVSLPSVQPLVFIAPTLTSRTPGIKKLEEAQDGSDKIIKEVPLPYLRQSCTSESRLSRLLASSISDPEDVDAVYTWLQHIARSDWKQLRQKALQRTLKHLAKVLERREETYSLATLAQQIRLRVRVQELDTLLRSSLHISEPPQDPVDFATEEYVANADLRRRVCRALFLSLRDHGCTAPESRRLAMQMEHELRRQDPTMKEAYRNLFRRKTRELGARKALCDSSTVSEATTTLQ